MSKSSPKKGDNVLVAVDPRTNNGDPEAVAVVVSVKEVEVSDDKKETRANLRVLLDADETKRMTNVLLQGDAPKEGDEPVGNVAYYTPAS